MPWPVKQYRYKYSFAEFNSRCSLGFYGDRHIAHGWLLSLVVFDAYVSYVIVHSDAIKPPKTRATVSQDNYGHAFHNLACTS